MRAAVSTAARLVLLAGPTALAFFSGGYFDGPRAWAGLGAWLLVAVAALAGAGSIPRRRAAWAVIGGLAVLAAWSLASITWAPLAGNAYHYGQIEMLYLGALIAASCCWVTSGRGRSSSPRWPAGC